MKMYRVGGVIRDKLLGEPTGDTDWVVVGATEQELLQRGYRRVGKDFPVFLHPETQDEYALARTERKTAPGYHGFEIDASPTVTLKQDLERRDLTINAIAEDTDGNLVDPFNGRSDIDKRLLRHVSSAFVEDPVRVLRVARFAARFAHLGFRVADGTMELMREMVASGEMDALVPERVWQETRKALLTSRPDVYIDVLRGCGALRSVFPELDALFGVPQPEQWHPEIDTGVHMLLVMRMVARLSEDPMVRFAALTHDLGKGSTPQAEWPSHRGHELRSAQLLEQLCDRLRVPNDYRDLARIVALHHGRCHRALEMRPSKILRLLEETDALRRPQRFHSFLLACEADARGRTGLEDRTYEQADRLRQALDAASGVSVADLDITGLDGAAIGARLHQARVGAIREALR
ncbi:MAG: multifunctional CCA addition/repair protein [Gammaproteobacteria bacterium]|nr:multifunctional CCA addition/repair protein [Gammaproteobacteria bacterium]